MNNGTLIKVSATDHCLLFRTVSRARKSPRAFWVTRDTLKKLESERVIETKDIHCFAVLRFDPHADTVSIDFTWLQDAGGGKVTGYEEIVTLPYSRLMAFEQESAQKDGPYSWKVLSVNTRRRPKVVFCNQERLRQCLSNGKVRRKLVRFLKNDYNWTGSDEVKLYSDFVPYSFLFHEFRDGSRWVVGGLILHGQENMDKAYYATHT